MLIIVNIRQFATKAHISATSHTVLRIFMGSWPREENVKYALKSQVVILQTAQTWANVGVCGGLCACAVGGTFDERTNIFNVAEMVFI